MDRAEVEKIVVEILCEQLDVSKEAVTLQAMLEDDLGADSIGVTELADF